ncbi:MAG TPA: hypothetical protein GXX28_03480, partial [Firmicutes bacterium]|nr:hypothetical protein [Bacillota bacterium]
MNPLFGAAALLTLTAAAGVAFWPHPRRARPSFGAVSLGLAALYLALGALPLASIQFSVGAAVLLRLTVSPRSSKGTPPAAGRSEAAELSETPATPWWRLGVGAVALLALGLFAGGVYPLAPPMPRPFAPPLPHYLLVAAGLFCLGLYGTLTHRH